jgi:hypothetical protein
MEAISMMRTYAPIVQDVDAEVKRANAVALNAILAGLACLAALSVVAIFTGIDALVWIGVAVFLLCILFGIGATYWHTAFPQRRNADEAAAQAAHDRQVEIEARKADTRVQLIDAETRRQIALASARAETLRLGDTAATRAIRTPDGATLFPPRPMPPAINMDTVTLADGRMLRLDIARAVAKRWPVQGEDDREAVRAEVGGFRNTAYTLACDVIRDYLAGVEDARPFDARMAVVKIQHALPRPDAAVPAENTGGAAGGGTGNGGGNGNERGNG